MGYNTNFTGDFSLNKFLKPEHYQDEDYFG
jgi:hypothetical protein